MSDDQIGLVDAVASLMVEAAQTIILPLFNNLSDEDIATKSSDSDFVTVADRDAEFWLIPKLEPLLADAIAIGEESISDDPKLGKKISNSLSFVIDPIDGTRNFINGSHHFCSMISLIDCGEPLISWIYRPIDNDIVVAVAGEGVFHMLLSEDAQLTDWEPVHRTFERFQLSDMIGTGGIKGLSGERKLQVRNQLRALAHRRLIGSAGCEAVLLALGEHDFLMHAKTTAWDHTPVDLIANEIGLFSASLPTANAYSPLCDDAILVAPDKDSWLALANHIWPDPVTKPQSF